MKVVDLLDFVLHPLFRRVLPSHMDSVILQFEQKNLSIKPAKHASRTEPLACCI